MPERKPKLRTDELFVIMGRLESSERISLPPAGVGTRAMMATWVAMFAACVLVTGCVNPARDWERTAQTNSVEGYEAYLRRYPQGEFSAEARTRLETLEWERARAQDNKNAY